MKRILGIAAVSLLGSLPAVADDADQWTGFHAGIFAGYGAGEADPLVRFDSIGSPDESINGLSSGMSVDGAFGGIYAGYNHVAGPLLIGLEADVALSNIENTIRRDDPRFIDDLTIEYDWEASLRARVGATSGPFHFYATGGLAIADVQTALQFTDGITGVSDNPIQDGAVEVGYAVGGGAETLLSDNLVLKLEYIYKDFGSKTVQTGDFWGNDNSDYTVDLNLHTARIGLAYKF